MTFRDDINALRAFAVLGVLLFHFLPDAVPGGFVGVDVFFVISGYLMTGIIVGGIDRGTFTLLNFYMGRVTRIMPALLVLCGILAGLGWVALDPVTYQQLALHVASSVLFVSNIIYWKQADYFDVASHEKWLLHTWSLSVEWQFYIIFPIVILLVCRFFSRRALAALLVGLFSASIIFALFTAYMAPVTAFYFLPARMWEMLAGGMVFLFAPKLSVKWKRPVAYCGAFLILVSFLLIDQGMPWPGPAAFLPILATVLVLVAFMEQEPLFSNSLVSWIGKRSYSLYLWHWPIVVAGNYLLLSGEILFVVFGIAASFAFAALSYSFVEERRHLFGANTTKWIRAACSPILLVAAAVVVVCGAVYVGKGMPERANPQFAKIVELQVMPSISNGHCFRSFTSGSQLKVASNAAECVLGETGAERSVLILGDSFAGTFEPFWDQVGLEFGVAIHSATTNWCFPSLEEHYMPRQTAIIRAQCKVNRQYALASATDHEFVVLGGAWGNIDREGFLGDTIAIAKELSRKGVHVVIMPSPVYYDTNVNLRFISSLFNSLPFDVAKVNRSADGAEEKANRRLADFAAIEPGIDFVSREDLIGDTETYMHGGRDVPLTLDRHHISLGGSLAIAGKIQASECTADGDAQLCALLSDLLTVRQVDGIAPPSIVRAK